MKTVGKEARIRTIMTSEHTRAQIGRTFVAVCPDV
jgi:hypothetical protein